MVKSTAVGLSLLASAVATAHAGVVPPIHGERADGLSAAHGRLLPVEFDVPKDAAVTDDVIYRVIQLYGQAVTPDLRASVFFDRGIADDREGNYGGAMQAYGQVIKFDPGNARAFNNRCFDEAILGALDSAIADCSESLRLRPSNASAFDSRGLAHLKLNHLEAAIADYDAALKIEPQLAMSLFGRGVAKRRKGDVAGGDADIAAAEAIKLDVADDMAKMGVHL